MKCWEYKTVTADSCDGLLSDLNKWGRNGFELVTIVTEMVQYDMSLTHTRHEVPQYVAIIKRDYDPYDGGPYIP